MTQALTLAGSANLVVAGEVRGTWRDQTARAAAGPDVPLRTASLARTGAEAVEAVARHLQGARESLVVAAARVDDALAQELRSEGFALLLDGAVRPAHDQVPVVPGRLWLLTSGSTGRPKRVAHTLSSLTTVASDQPPRRWLCPYSAGAYAWWQLVTLSLAHPGQDLVFVDPAELDDWPEVAEAEGVTAVSGTPTFWRQALLRSGDRLARLPLAQVTLGGEPVDQVLLDRLAGAFPAARLSWIYASSEAGASIAVHDRKAGFPATWLDRRAPGRPGLSVEGDELLIDSPYSADGIRGRLRTGDRVSIVDGRVLITGRLAGDEINVGGSKVLASSVREVLQSHPRVLWSQVRGRRAPLVGQVVVADVVLTDEVGVDELRAWCSARLPEAAVPRRMRVLPEIPMKETLKSDV